MSEDNCIQSAMVDSLFDIFEELCEGAVSVDENARIVWINSKYLNLLGVADEDEVLGRDVQSVIPESMLAHVVETGQPILLDIMRFNNRHFVVSRLPLHNEDGVVIGAVGFVLYDSLDYLKPLISKFELLQQRLSSAEAKLAAARRTRYSIANIIGRSQHICDLKEQARAVARHTSPVLILGETGTGKELLAQSVHSASVRRHEPFVAVNLAAVPENLLEAEFFGVSPGAYTGADKRTGLGKFALANGGTLFLDEIGDMPLQLQAKLLRVLEEQEFEPVGSNAVQRVDVRIIAATSQDLEAKVRQGGFRSDLYYRLNVLLVAVPPLRERLDDIKPLSEYFLETIASRSGDALKVIDPDGLAVLESHNWPGNVRELKNTLERACLMCDSAGLSADGLRPFVPRGATAPVTAAAETGLSLPARIASIERQAISRALEMTGGKKAPAARILGISRSQLYDKIRDHRLYD
ncbi:sigma-54 interaction domain-containing protein [Sedimenticola hydrogenitrophicus]|uniref:sigma-54 interaction domain-containing protein n=1 Tax=Sedimenticola hydrogenitrophicus TaxID=2967975 RepID=UPI0021A93D60|nr:sigma 54-interacting transcriptional regulator [Sedimenticola hydrogenitrophicus]